MTPELLRPPCDIASADDAAPKCGAKVIERRRIVGPRGTLVWRFQVVGHGDGTEGRVERLVLGRRAHVAGEALLDRAERGEVFLRFEQRHGVRAACQRGPAQLMAVVLPEQTRQMSSEPG